VTAYGRLNPPVPALLYANGQTYDVEIVRRRRGRVDVRNTGDVVITLRFGTLTHRAEKGDVIAVPESMTEVRDGR
jgi:hypothetical protein